MNLLINAAPVRCIRSAVMKDLGVPEDMMTFINYPTRFNSRDKTAALTRVATRLGTTVALLHAVAPRVTQSMMNTTFRMFPDSSAAKSDKGEKTAKTGLSAQVTAMADMMRGIHF